MNWCKQYQFKITTMNWERVFLEFKIETDCPEKVEFAFAQFQKDTPNEVNINKFNLITLETVDIKPDTYEPGCYTFSINIAAVDRRSFLNNGRWSLIAKLTEGFAIVEVAADVAYRLDDLSRIFRYGKGKYAYNLSLSTNGYDPDVLEIIFNSYFLIVNDKWKKRKYIQEAFTFKGKVERFYMFLVIRLIRIFYGVVSRITPKDGTRVLFMTETKDYLWGNLKYLDDRIKQRGLDKTFKLSYSCRKAVGSGKSVISWVKTVFNVARQDYIFIDDFAPIFGYFRLSPKTKLIQVWHAGEGFKSVGYSRFGKDGSPFPSESCHKAYDYALTGSRNLIKVYEEVFGIEKEAFLPTGMARLDDFLDEEKIEAFRNEFYNEYPELKGKKIVLFAPTFRGAGQKEAYYDYDKLDLKQIYDFCGDEWIFLVKMHPFVSKKISIPEEFRSRIIDFTKYPNINDLYYITELLITDYSSNYYEYALMKKPVLFYTYDREMYELTRGVHRSVKDHAPGKVCDTFEEMIEALNNRDFEVEKINKFVEDNFGEYDGKACDKAIDSILLKRS